MKDCTNESSCISLLRLFWEWFKIALFVVGGGYAIIVVAASEPVRFRRVMTRDHCTMEQVQARMAMQLPQSEKVTKADYVIVHDEDDEDEFLMDQVKRILKSFCSTSR